MKGLPAQHRLILGNYRLMLCHGSPRRTNEFLWKSTTSSHFLDCLLDSHDADVILATHTGIKWHRQLERGRHFVNIGVLGRPENDGHTNVWYTLIEANPDLSVTFVPVEYDHHRLAADMAEEKLPEEFMVKTTRLTSAPGLEILPAKERRKGKH